MSIFSHQISIIFVLRGGGGGGAGILFLENLNLRYGLKSQDTSRLFRVVLGPCTQCCSCETSNQKWGQKPKSSPKEKSFKSVIIQFASNKQAILIKECQNRMKNNRIMLRERSHMTSARFWQILPPPLPPVSNCQH